MKAIVILHNYLRLPGESYTTAMRRINPNGDDIPNDNAFRNLRGAGIHAGQVALDVKETLADYFVSPVGRLPWQRRAAGLDL